MDNLEIKSFKDIDIKDVFFDSLRDNYPGFDEWFHKGQRLNRKANVFYDSDHHLVDFLYLKDENEEIEMDEKNLPARRRLKVGTFKIISRHTTRGERFMKKILDEAISKNVEEVYVTMFDDSKDIAALRKLFETYGFKLVGHKKNENGRKESVLVRKMSDVTGDMLKDYPRINLNEGSKYLLSIYPLYHSKLFSDSMLKTEHFDILKDTSAANGIYKIYICWMEDVHVLRPGDKLIIYRTNDGLGPAYYRSVATSLCTVVEVKTNRDFESKADFLDYCKYSVFEKDKLIKWYESSRLCYVIKMLYNVAFKKRVIRKELIEVANIPTNLYWGFFRLSDMQFERILNLGNIDERYIIHQE